MIGKTELPFQAIQNESIGPYRIAWHWALQYFFSKSLVIFQHDQMAIISFIDLKIQYQSVIT